MRKLTITPRFNDYNFNLIEDLVNAKFSNDFKEFMKEYAGLSHVECVYFDQKGTQWEVTKYFSFPDIYRLAQEFLNAGWGKMIPFAYDPGGWHFCLCLEEHTMNAIFINRWTDHLPEDQFIKIADNFEIFVDGLRAE
jgi:hypothetical protein